MATDNDAAASTRVLCVDDSITFRAALRLAFANWPNIVVVESPTKALAQALAAVRKADPWEVFVIDIVMEPFDGVELSRRLRSMRAYQSTPIILLSGLDDLSRFEVAARALGAQLVSKDRQTGAQLVRLISNVKRSPFHS